MLQRYLLPLLVAALAMAGCGGGQETVGEAPSYNELVKPKTGLIASGGVKELTINRQDSTLEVKRINGESFLTGYPPNSEHALRQLFRASRVRVQVEKKK